MIHATQPFVVNEWIQSSIEGYEVSGTVEVCVRMSNYMLLQYEYGNYGLNICHLIFM